MEKIPNKTGIYQLQDEGGTTIYVGKAKNLHARVAQHFSEKNKSLRARKMRESVASVACVETESEVSALVLENNLIKKLQPKFNVLLRDDKSFIFIGVSWHEDFPRIFTTRKREQSAGVKYFGPKTNTAAAKQTVEFLQKLFKFRTCRGEIFENEGEILTKNFGQQKFPCLEFHIGKCSAPCCGKVAKEKYRAQVAAAMKFLRGQHGEILQILQNEMREAAGKQNFERAATLRDQIRALESTGEKQLAEKVENFDADVIGVASLLEKTFFCILQIRDGKILGAEHFHIPSGESPGEDLLGFLHQWKNFQIPKHLLLPVEFFPESEKTSWESFLNVKILLPKKGDRRKLVDLAGKNAASFAARNTPKFLKVKNENLLQDLQKTLGLPGIPQRIEAFDISHLAGQHCVGSMVVLDHGERAKSHFRKFKIKTLSGKIDDFAAMAEMLRRRLRHLPAQLPAAWRASKCPAKECTALQERFGQTGDAEKEKEWHALKAGKAEKEILALCSKVAAGEQTALLGDFFVKAEKVSPLQLQTFLKIVLGKLKVKKFWANSRSDLCTQALRNVGFQDFVQVPAALREQSGTNLVLGKAKLKQDPSLTCTPDLILLDGGKGQLSAVAKVLAEFPHLQGKLPLAALAKRNEEIFVPGRASALPVGKNSGVSLLLQRVRDEAHRFALTFNRFLREQIAGPKKGQAADFST